MPPVKFPSRTHFPSLVVGLSGSTGRAIEMLPLLALLLLLLLGQGAEAAPLFTVAFTVVEQAALQALPIVDQVGDASGRIRWRGRGGYGSESEREREKQSLARPKWLSQAGQADKWMPDSPRLCVMWRPPSPSTKEAPQQGHGGKGGGRERSLCVREREAEGESRRRWTPTLLRSPLSLCFCICSCAVHTLGVERDCDDAHGRAQCLVVGCGGPAAFGSGPVSLSVPSPVPCLDFPVITSRPRPPKLSNSTLPSMQSTQSPASARWRLALASLPSSCTSLSLRPLPPLPIFTRAAYLSPAQSGC